VLQVAYSQIRDEVKKPEENLKRAASVKQLNSIEQAGEVIQMAEATLVESQQTNMNVILWLQMARK
jgi:hypothetical protein